MVQCPPGGLQVDEGVAASVEVDEVDVDSVDVGVASVDVDSVDVDSMAAGSVELEGEMDEDGV